MGCGCVWGGVCGGSVVEISEERGGVRVWDGVSGCEKNSEKGRGEVGEECGQEQERKRENGGDRGRGEVA